MSQNDHQRPQLICHSLLGEHGAAAGVDAIFPEMNQVISLIDEAEKTVIIGVGPEVAANLSFPSRDDLKPLIKDLCASKGRPKWIELHGKTIKCGMLATSSAEPGHPLQFIRLAFWCQSPNNGPVFIPALARFNPDMIRRSAARGLLQLIGKRPSARQEFSRAVTLYETDGTRKILRIITSQEEYRPKDAARFGECALDIAYAGLNYLVCPPKNAKEPLYSKEPLCSQPQNRNET